ncbi:MAG: YHS domain-containing (seleno)protein [Bacteroidota bacterium]
MKNLTLFILVILSQNTFSQSAEVRGKHFNVKKNLGIQGYDPVSYFNRQPQEGNESIKAEHKGITYYFENTKNRDTFTKSPAKYEPQYGGWCAYAMGETGDKVKIDPETYKIKDGRLYLFYNFWGTNTLESWNKKENSLKTNGDKNWSEIIN